MLASGFARSKYGTLPFVAAAGYRDGSSAIPTAKAAVSNDRIGNTQYSIVVIDHSKPAEYSAIIGERAVSHRQCAAIDNDVLLLSDQPAHSEIYPVCRVALDLIFYLICII